MTELKDLSPEQKEVVGTWGQGLAVLAGAGSGKTTTMVIKCAELLKRKADARFAAVSFTERSASDLREKLSARLSLNGEGGALSGHWVMTIHGLCGAIIREYPREAGFDGEEGMLSEPEAQLLWERSIESLWTEELPPKVSSALDSLLERESSDSLVGLLRRVKSLFLFRPLESLESSGNPHALALAQLSAYVIERYDRLKRRKGALDFDDLERGADRALAFPHIRQAFQKRFDLIIVDEFQDTNPVQARIIWRLAKSDSSNLCVVGDPKQSIYRFRDADVTVFDEYRRKLPVQLSLTWNFRSRPAIIDFANEVCAPCFAASDLEYERLVAKREADPKLESVVRLDVDSPSGLASWIRTQMDQGLPLHEMALLLRKIRGNEKWLKSLTSSGIPIAVGSGGLFWEDPRVRELTAFLKWWDNPLNSLAGAVFLRAPWVGVSDLSIDEWTRVDRTFVTPFFASSHPLASKLKELKDRAAVRPGELLMSLLINDEIEAELGAPLLGLWHRAEELSSRGLDAHAVIMELALSMKDSRRERDVPPPRNLGQLSVLTLHGSKGLEYPHVILIDFPEKAGRASDAPLLFWDREKGAFLAGRDSEGERDKKDPVELAWRAEENARNLAECKRLFYVALTRARERLVVVCLEPTPTFVMEESPKKTTKPKEVVSSYLRDFWRGWLDESGVEVPRVRVTQGMTTDLGLKGEGAPLNSALEVRPRVFSHPVGMKRARHSVTEWNTLSRCPRAYEWTFIRPVTVAKGIPEIGLFTGEKVPTFVEQELTQRELGTRVHSCLERADFDELKRLEAQVGLARFVAEPVISWALSSPLMAPPISGKREVWTELAFELPVAGETLSVPWTAWWLTGRRMESVTPSLISK